MTISADEPGLALARLLQLASPTLPVGGFSYSQGLEAAVAAGVVTDARSAAGWIGDVLAGPVGACEAGFLARFMRLWQALDAAVEGGDHAGVDAGVDALVRLDRLFQASREGAELLAETRQMGWSMLSIARGLPAGAAGPGWSAIGPLLERLAQDHAPSYPLTWSAFAVAARLPAADALTAWLWSWLENQVMAALKTIPLGQSAGQALLFSLGARLAPLATRAVGAAAQASAEGSLACADPAQSEDDGPGNLAPGFGLACAQHETQYSRLFRS